MPFLLSFLMMLVFVGTALVIFLKNNWRNHLILLFCLSIYFVYLYLTPSFYASQKDFAKFNNEFGNYFIQGMWIYFLAITIFLFGYLLVNLFYRKAEDSGFSQVPIVRDTAFNFQRLDLLFYCILLLNIIALSYKGFSLNNIFNPNLEDMNLEQQEKGSFNAYLLFFSDSLISVLLAAFLFGVKKKKLLLWVVVSFFIFLILGFRYRILLTLVGFISIYFFYNKVQLKKILYYPILLLAITYTIVFISNNRKQFRSLNYSEISFGWQVEKEHTKYFQDTKDPMLFSQTNNFSTDFSVLKSFELDMIDHDYGESMIYHIFVRLIPSVLFEDGVKPAIPQQIILRECFGSSEGFGAGAAVTNIFEYYIAFGELGAYFCMFIFGASLAFISMNLNLNDPISIFKYVIITAICFQVITRGYTPQVINHLAYMLIPYFVIKKWIYTSKLILSNK